MQYIVNNFINNGEVKLDNVVSLIYCRFIVRFTIGLEFLFITFLFQFFLVQMSSLWISSSATYSTTFSTHIYIYLSIDIISIYLKVAMHQGSVLSPLLFGVGMDVVLIEATNGIPSELLYADELVFMALIIEPLGRRVTE